MVLAEGALEREVLLAAGASLDVAFKLDLRCRVELAVYERAEMTAHQLTAHDFSAFLERNASSDTGSSASSSSASMMPSCFACCWSEL